MRKRSWIRNLFARPAIRPIRKAPHSFRPALEVLESRWVPSIVVNNPTDTPVAGETDLRQAIAQANTNGGNETIAFLRKRVPNLAVLDEDLLSSDPAARREDDRRGKDAARLADALGNLPIAAEHAAAYLAETGAASTPTSGCSRRTRTSCSARTSTSATCGRSRRRGACPGTRFQPTRGSCSSSARSSRPSPSQRSCS